MYNFMYKLETTNFTDLAIVHKNEQLTYGQLLTKSKIIGNCLKNCMGKPIGFYLHNKINVVPLCWASGIPIIFMYLSIKMDQMSASGTLLKTQVYQLF